MYSGHSWLRLFDFNRDKKYEMIRPDENVAKYTMIEHKIDDGNRRNTGRYKLLHNAKNRWQNDGLNNLKYEIVDEQNFGVFYRYTVNL